MKADAISLSKRAVRPSVQRYRARSIAVACCLSAMCSGMQSRVNDDKAEQVMRDIRAAESGFRTKNGRFASAGDLIETGGVTSVSRDLAVFDHRFEISATKDTYEAVAVPVGRDDRYEYVGWSFYLDESGVIRGRPYGKANEYVAAGKKDPAVQSQ